MYVLFVVFSSLLLLDAVVFIILEHSVRFTCPSVRISVIIKAISVLDASVFTREIQPGCLFDLQSEEW